MNRARIRDLGIQIGSLPTGQYNAITDVPGVLVGHATLIEDQPGVVRTGVTVILPRQEIGNDYAFAGFHRFNGCGEMTGVQWLEETGLISSAIGITNTRDVGMLRDAMSEYSYIHGHHGPFWLPVATETYDGWLNDMGTRTLTKEHVFQAFANAKSGPVDEGNVGGGTGMICHDFKGGIGTSSRIVETKSGTFTVGALVQANHGSRALLRVNGVPVGLEIGLDKVPGAWVEPPAASSIIIVVGTDAPLLSDQCRRLAQRATVGMARVGGNGHNTSGDLFLAFSTAHHVPAQADELIPLAPILPNRHINPIFDAVADAVEEAILNVLAAAETMSGAYGHTVHALPLDELKKVMEKYRPK
jgi:D-aminopeptidase